MTSSVMSGEMLCAFTPLVTVAKYAKNAVICRNRGGDSIWQTEFDHEVICVKLADDCVVVQTRGELAALALKSGMVLWFASMAVEVKDRDDADRTGMHLTSEHGGLAVVADGDGNVRAFALAGGAQVWAAQMDSVFVLQLTGDHGGLAVAGDSSGNVRAFALASGAEVWAAHGWPPRYLRLTSEHGGLAVVADDGIDGGQVRAFALAGGAEVWAAEQMSCFLRGLQLTGEHGGLAVAAGGRSAIGLQALALASGAKVWATETELPKLLQLTGEHGGMVVVDDGDIVRAFALAGGAEVWAARMPTNISQRDQDGYTCHSSRVQLTGEQGGLAVVRDDGGNVKAFALAGGAEVWAARMTTRISFLQLTSEHGGLAVVWDEAGDVRALALASGAEVWAAQMPGIVCGLQLTGEHGGLAVTGDSSGNVSAFALASGATCDVDEALSNMLWTGMDSLEVTDLGYTCDYPGYDPGAEWISVLSGSHRVAGTGYTVVMESSGFLRLVDDRTSITIQRVGCMRPDVCRWIAVHNGICVAAGWQGRIIMWDLNAAMRGLEVASEKSEWAKVSVWSKWTEPTAAVKYAIAQVALTITSLQLIAFSAKLPLPDGPVKTVVQSTRVLQTLGLGDWLPKLQLFQAVFIADCLIVWIFVSVILVVQEPLENRAWYQPRSWYATAFKTLGYFTMGIGTVGFVPLTTTMMRALPCKGTQMMEIPDEECMSVRHVSLCILGLVTSFIFTLLTWRLATVRFDLKAIEIQPLKPFDTSRDTTSKTPRLVHPLAMQSARYEQVIIPIKLIMAISKYVFQTRDILHAVTLFGCGACLTVVGIIYDKYAPQQVAAGRSYEPNAIGTAIDAATTWHFAGQLLMLLFGGKEWWPLTWLWPASMLLVVVIAYWFRASGKEKLARKLGLLYGLRLANLPGPRGSPWQGRFRLRFLCLAVRSLLWPARDQEHGAQIPDPVRRADSAPALLRSLREALTVHHAWGRDAKPAPARADDPGSLREALLPYVPKDFPPAEPISRATWLANERTLLP